MGRELNHGEAAAFLGAYALDALDEDERVQVERHIRECRACQTEVSEHREAVAYLAPTSTRAPEGLWDRIAGSLEETPPPLQMPPAPVVPIERARRRRAMPSRLVAAAAAVATVAVIGVVGVNVVDDGPSGREVAVAPAAELNRTVRAAVADPTARRIELVSADRGLRADTVVLPDGTGYLVSSNLPELGPQRTYQLWALVGTDKISVGVLGTKPSQTGFKAAADAWGFAITAEKAGGVVATQNDPVVVGRRA